jgi:hypothetical protein
MQTDPGTFSFREGIASISRARGQKTSQEDLLNVTQKEQSEYYNMV